MVGGWWVGGVIKQFWWFLHVTLELAFNGLVLPVYMYMQ